ncbi:MAG: universal stress protein [Sediminibacterium sp.]|nr:universal stress protein [Sediminibacterium sp.]
MEAILLPTDFSATAKNAAVYALQLANQLGVKKLVLYHSYEIPVTIDPLVPGIQMLDIDSLKEDSIHNLTGFRNELKPTGNTEITLLSEYGALTEGLDEVCKKVNAGLVVMGITGGGLLEEKLIGSNTISVAKHTRVPVIIVPVETSFTPVKAIMLTSDYEKTDKSIPVNAVRKVIAETNAKLYVFVIDEDAGEAVIKYPSDGSEEGSALYSLLADLSPEFHFSQNKHYVEAVNEFAVEYHIDMVISIEKKHGFFERMFTSSHTKMLAFHSHVPLMVIHD